MKEPEVCPPSAGNAPPKPDYLLLDGAKIRPLLPALYRLEAQPDWVALYEDTELEPLRDIGPVLVRLPNQSELLPAFEQNLGPQGQALALWSCQPMDVVVSHLRSLLILHKPAGPWLFRFYEPRALERIHRLPPAAQTQTFFGPVNRLRWFDAETSSWRDWVNPCQVEEQSAIITTDATENQAERFSLPRSWLEALRNLNAK